jgi:hypothetical protein
MWVTTPPSPLPSAPATPSLPSSTTPNSLTFPQISTTTLLQSPTQPQIATQTTHTMHTPTSMPPQIHTSTSAAVSAASLPGASISGRLSGVVSLTDVLNLFARASGLNPGDPSDRRRRESSSSSGGVSRLSLSLEPEGGR